MILLSIALLLAPPPVASGRSAARCAPYQGEQFILCAEGWKPDHGKMRRIAECEPHRPGSKFAGPYGLSRHLRARYGGCGREAFLKYINERYHGSIDEAVAHHKKKDWY